MAVYKCFSVYIITPLLHSEESLVNLERGKSAFMVYLYYSLWFFANAKTTCPSRFPTFRTLDTGPAGVLHGPRVRQAWWLHNHFYTRKLKKIDYVCISVEDPKPNWIHIRENRINTRQKVPLFSCCLKKEIFLKDICSSQAFLKNVSQNSQHNPGPGSELGQNPGSGSKFNVFGSHCTGMNVFYWLQNDTFLGFQDFFLWRYSIKYLVSVEYCAYKIIQQILPTEVRYCILR